MELPLDLVCQLGGGQGPLALWGDGDEPSGQRGDHAKHFHIVFIRHHAHDEGQPLFGEVFFEAGGEGLHPVRVVSSVH